jgi:hypothetical protein
MKARVGSRDGVLAAYVTSHGFGHLNRVVTVLNRIPADVAIEIRCAPDLFQRWGERLRREVRFSAGVYDAGAVNPPGDSSSTDGVATLERAIEVHAAARAGLDAEADWLRSRGVSVVLCDVPAPPLSAAARAGIPGCLLANFTWADIYAPLAARGLVAGGRELVRDLRREYRKARVVFRAEPGMAMSWLPGQVPVGLVMEHGQDRRRELEREFGLSRGVKLAGFYVGRYGQRDLAWERLEGMGRLGVHFVSLHAPDGEVPGNFHVVRAEAWSGADLAASVDVMVAKAGYGVVSEAMAAGAPLIYPPRSGFAEHRILDRALRAWGGGIPVSAQRFREMRIERAIERAVSGVRLRRLYRTDGAERVARSITRIGREGVLDSRSLPGK